MLNIPVIVYGKQGSMNTKVDELCKENINFWHHDDPVVNTHNTGMISI